MTRDEILNMPASRELDALIAEKVMGWKNVRMGRDDYGGEPTPRIYNTFDPDEVGSYVIWCPIPKYSTDISAAWEVVEKLRLAIIPKTEGLEGWLAKWDNNYIYSSGGDEDEKNPMIGWPEMEWLSHIIDADSAPLAICRAALLAIGDKL